MRAFTLTEILITLGVLGSIAAMTIPTLAFTYRGKVLEQQYKAVYSDLKEISSKINTENGDIGEFANKRLNANNATNADLWAESFMGFLLSSSKISNKSTTVETLKSIYAQSGRPVGPKNFSNNNIAPICGDSSVWLDGKGRLFTFNKANRIICVDINGTNSPNKVNIDIFAFKAINASENARISGEAGNVEDYSGTIIPCNLAKVKFEADHVANTGCPFYSPMEDSVPKSGGKYETSSHGNAMTASNNYWKDYIDYR